MLVAVDLDGVIRDVMTPFISAYNRENSTSLGVQDLTYYNKPEVLTGGFSQLVSFLEEHDCFRAAECYKGAGAFIGKISKYHDVCFVSAQPSFLSRVHALEWLEHCKFPTLPIHFCPNKVSVLYDVLVEDCPVHVDAALLEGRYAIFMKRPWNVLYTGEARTVKSFKEAVEYLDTLSANFRASN